MNCAFLSGSVVGIGSTRAPKIAAVEQFCRAVLSDSGLPMPRIEARGVPSGTESTPKSVQSMMVGARHRAETVRSVLEKEGLTSPVAIGLEGGVWQSRVERGSIALLESWAFVTDGERGHFGSSGAIPLPGTISKLVFDDGLELGDAADQEFQTRDIAGGAGTFGVLSANLVTREAAFVRALLHAFAPFYNDRAYGRETRSR